MPTPTTHNTGPQSSPAPTLHVALDLGNTSWCLAAAPAVASPPRVRMFPARSLARLHAELASARHHFGLPADAPVVLCYEAGRDGFWLQHACTAAGILALVVDSSSIEVSRRARRAKTDRLDATALLRLLFRHTAGERGHWRVLHVPTVEEDDRIQHQRIHPGRPQQNGAHERMHRTLKRQATRPVKRTCAAQQRVFNAFRTEYNTERPHEYLNQETPGSHYTTSPRPFPTRLPPLEYPGHYLVKKVTTGGTFRLHHKLLYIANSLVDEYIGLEETDDGVWSIFFNTVLIATVNERDYIIRE